MLSGFFSPGFFLVQHILHKWGLISRGTVPTAERIEKRVTVLDEERRKDPGRLPDLHSRRLICVFTSGAVIEEHGGKGSGSRRLPQKALEMQLSALKLNYFRDHRT